MSAFKPGNMGHLMLSYYQSEENKFFVATVFFSAIKVSKTEFFNYMFMLNVPK